MAAIILTSVGGMAGSAMGGAMGAAIGYMAGSLIGNAIDARFATPHRAFMSGSRLNELIVQTSTYGKTMPMVYGQTRLAGNIIWSLPIKETQHQQTTQGGGKGGGGGGVSVTSTSYTYSVTLAIAICEGPIDNILTIWADAKQLSINQGVCRLYKGTETQLPDPLIEAHMGMGKTPAYRGLAYIVIEDFPLADYGNRIPNFTFEVKRRAKIEHQQNPAVEDLLTAICMIPGSGEFVYDTIDQFKINGEKYQKGKAQPINHHNSESKANALLALDQLSDTCPNIKWIALVVTWFGTSLDIGDCKILPGVEFRTNVNTWPDQWHVEKYNREQAHQITLVDKSPIYGGTVSDQSVIRYLEEMRQRGYKIMLYPMIFIDKTDKPWRGHMTGSATNVERFFEHEQGYRRFITHYANIAKDRVDAFVIGSELKNITKIRDRNNQFPAVDKFCNLAEQIRAIVGPNIKLTYAADWSEYHHSEGGWYHMDKLWAHKDIDFVGIDAYFPITNDDVQTYDEQHMIDGWTSGEGYDFYYHDSKKKERKSQLAAEYAWKNIEWFWQNTHKNPDGKITPWVPKSKKIWFTEFGYPSLDLASNEPNVFYDPRCIDGGIPHKSSGKVDFLAQRTAITAALVKWQGSEMLENMFLWTWDARPYPYWPALTHVWADGPMWLRGHWVNGKFGLCRLSDIIAELCIKSGLSSEQFDVTELTDLVDGYVVAEQQSARAMIENLANVYFFDMVESDGKLKFTSRRDKKVTVISSDVLVKDKLLTTRAPELDLPKNLALMHMDRSNNYQPNVAFAVKVDTLSQQQLTFDTRLVITPSLADIMAKTYLHNIWLERMSYKFILPPSYLYLEPADVVELDNKQMRITNITYCNKRMLHVTAVASDLSLYNQYIEPDTPTLKFTVDLQPQYQCHLLDLPARFMSESDESVLYVAVVNMVAKFKPAAIYYSVDEGHSFQYLTNIMQESIIGSISDPLLAMHPVVIDYGSKLNIVLINGQLESYDLARMLNGKNFALVGDEIIQFAKAKMLMPGVYQLSHLLRGCQGTEHLIKHHPAGSRFILLDHRLTAVKLKTSILGINAQYCLAANGQKIDDLEKAEFNWQGNSLRPLAPVNLTYKNNRLSWIRRARINGSWRNNIDVALDEDKELYEVEIYHNDILYETITTGETYCVIPELSGKLTFCVYQLSGKVGRGVCARYSLSS